MNELKRQLIESWMEESIEAIRNLPENDPYRSIFKLLVDNLIDCLMIDDEDLKRQKVSTPPHTHDP